MWENVPSNSLQSKMPTIYLTGLWVGVYPGHLRILCVHIHALCKGLWSKMKVSKGNVDVMLLYIRFKKYKIKLQVLLEYK